MKEIYCVNQFSLEFRVLCALFCIILVTRCSSVVALLSWSTANQSNCFGNRLSCLSALIILLIVLQRREITIFLPHSHMPTYLTDVCDKCGSILAHVRLQCIDRAVIPCAVQMRPSVYQEVSEEEEDL